MRAALRTQQRAILASVTFLSLIPVGRGMALDGDDVARGAVFFPITGGVLGGITGLIDWQLGTHASPLLTASIVAALAVGLTGGLHIDGLADFADGFGGRTVPDRLRIMRDSCVGTYGSCSLVLDVAIRIGAYADVAGHPAAIGIATAAGALSRAAGPPLAAVNEYAQPDRGIGSTLRKMGSKRTTIATSAVAVAIAASAVGYDAAIAIPIAAASVAVVGISSRRRLGGITGDTVGAAIELSEVAVLAALACLS
jgi:cobalamin 5'-phosphate synthase/cobalamin synthase